MSKVIQVINVIISNSDKINKVNIGICDPPMYFFLYDKKHKWSIYKDKYDNYYLKYYTSNLSIKDLSSKDASEWTSFHDYISYSSSEFKSREANESLRELYLLIKEIASGVDSAFDEIIDSDDTF